MNRYGRDTKEASKSKLIKRKKKKGERETNLLCCSVSKARCGRKTEAREADTHTHNKVTVSHSNVFKGGRDKSEQELKLHCMGSHNITGASAAQLSKGDAVSCNGENDMLRKAGPLKRRRGRLRHVSN